MSAGTQCSGLTTARFQGIPLALSALVNSAYFLGKPRGPCLLLQQALSQAHHTWHRQDMFEYMWSRHQAHQLDNTNINIRRLKKTSQLQFWISVKKSTDFNNFRVTKFGVNYAYEVCTFSTSPKKCQYHYLVNVFAIQTLKNRKCAIVLCILKGWEFTGKVEHHSSNASTCSCHRHPSLNKTSRKTTWKHCTLLRVLYNLLCYRIF